MDAAYDSYENYRFAIEDTGAAPIIALNSSRVLEGKQGINQKFIIGAVAAFPGYKFDDLFYLVPEEIQNDRRDVIVNLRNAGLSYAEIGRRLGISRERVRQVVHHKTCLNNSNAV